MRHHSSVPCLPTGKRPRYLCFLRCLNHPMIFGGGVADVPGCYIQGEVLLENAFMCRMVFTMSVAKRQKLPVSPAPKSLFQSLQLFLSAFEFTTAPQVSVWPATPFTTRARIGNCLLKKKIFLKVGLQLCQRGSDHSGPGGWNVPLASC